LDNLGAGGYIAVAYDDHCASKKLQEDLTSCSLIRLHLAYFIFTIVVVAVACVKSPLSIRLLLCCRMSSEFGPASYFDATLDSLKLSDFNDAISIVVGDIEDCHLPLRVNFELKLWCCKRKCERKN
jgi:hypothetical protein